MALVDVDEVFRKRRCPKAMLDPSTSSEREEEEGVKIMEEGNILHSLYEQVSESRSKLKLLKEQISGMDSLPMKSIEGCSSSSVKQKVDELMDYESSARTLNKESELLRSGVFEDLSRDEGIHYFLAIAEVQKNIRGLRELKQMGDRILGDNLEHAKLVEDILLERNGVDKRIREEMERSKDDEMNENGASSQLNDEAEKEKTAIKVWRRRLS
ncbi:Uncharacterized protein FKW44_001799 [Caligus rogercresseyi]|uniref:Uncharacterized protein n=1 Tax=Caligus rogercresseyi TaxID=217165 RepID=A0A7T8KJ89_CALRO|nr:Uncharacterized protein FKW44_001799 [Caligus rogercresseyi]